VHKYFPFSVLGVVLDVVGEIIKVVLYVEIRHLARMDFWKKAEPGFEPSQTIFKKLSQTASRASNKSPNQRGKFGSLAVKC
jgi:hypothetical protein